MSPLAWVLLSLLIALLAFQPRFGLTAVWRSRASKKRRRLYEDALKHILAWGQRGQDATPESLAGALELSPRRALDLINRLEAKGLLRSSAGALRLTPEGERLGLHVVRAHRLWERYLADEAGVPLDRLHQAAEKAEHELTAETVDRLDAHLGHPLRDPHGDPIPRADGSVAALEGTVLTDWPAGESARIIHIEDEPAVVFQQIVAAGLRPGSAVRILERDVAGMAVSDGENEHRLSHAVAANILVARDVRAPRRPEGLIRLSDLPAGQEAEVAELDRGCRGFGRRRLMDLGLTPHARVRVALENTFGDPRAYRVRGTTVALRRPQSEQVWVRPIAADQEHAA